MWAYTNTHKHTHTRKHTHTHTHTHTQTCTHTHTHTHTRTHTHVHLILPQWCAAWASCQRSRAAQWQDPPTQTASLSRPPPCLLLSPSPAPSAPRTTRWPEHGGGGGGAKGHKYTVFIRLCCVSSPLRPPHPPTPAPHLLTQHTIQLTGLRTSGQRGINILFSSPGCTMPPPPPTITYTILHTSPSTHLPFSFKCSASAFYTESKQTFSTS